ncbi:hypothetical protein Fot_24595 [Forsythia ovata]|uniref:Uncharacterized protein n=1 Tax=Forsythia ovata TaxID=205694 RepID=A0ABD1U6M8_9LAMI
MAGFHFSKIHVFKIRCGRVVDERVTILLRLLTLSTSPILVPTVPPVVDVVGIVSSFLPTPVPIRPSEDVDHQGKGKGVVVDEWKKVTPKRTLQDEGDAASSA